jgi:hypothetical protein
MKKHSLKTADCDHVWIKVGGCKENPGVWGVGGAAIQVTETCETCGSTRTKIIGDVGSPSRNHGWDYADSGELRKEVTP